MRSLFHHFSILRPLRFTSLGVFAIAAAACGGNGISNNYPLDSDPAPNTFEIQILGDSYFDFQGHIPRSLIDLSGAIYLDRSETNSRIKDVDLQVDAALAEDAANAAYRIKTVIINAGANDLKGDCITSKNQNGLSEDCLTALAKSNTAITNLLKKLTAKIDNVVWAGRYYMRKDVAPKAAVDAHNQGVIQACAQFENCHFVEVRGADNDGDDLRWTYADASPTIVDGVSVPSLYVLNSDGQHVTQLGGQNIATLIWQEMEAENIFR